MNIIMNLTVHAAKHFHFPFLIC